MTQTKNYLFSIEQWLYNEIINTKPTHIKRTNKWMQTLLIAGLQVKLSDTTEQLEHIKKKLAQKGDTKGE